MKIKRHRDFISENNSQKSIEQCLEEKGYVLESGYWNYHDKNDTIWQRETRSVLIKGGKLTIKFGKIDGGILIPGDADQDNKLTSLEGLPREVSGILDISGHNITSLKGIGDFGMLDASKNKLTDLEGLPKEIFGYLDVHKNQITTLEGGPKKIHGYFDVSENELTDMRGCPLLESSIYLSDNPLKTLYGLKRIDRSISITERGLGSEVPEEEMAFLKNVVSSAGYEFKDYVVEMVQFVVENFGAKAIINLNLPKEHLSKLPKDVRNIYISAKGMKKFNI